MFPEMKESKTNGKKKEGEKEGSREEKPPQQPREQPRPQPQNRVEGARGPQTRGRLARAGAGGKKG